jgi:alpha-beta hydrolase superfamily lysophospholipase
LRACYLKAPAGALLVVLSLPARLCVGAPSNAAAARPEVVQTTFESVDATIAGQWDFPLQTPAPLVVIVPANGRLDRNGWAPDMGEPLGAGIYQQLASRLVAGGFAVFRYDKPGAGRSSPGHFATERSTALEAYTHAVQHARVDPEHVFLLGHGGGTDTIAGIYPRFAAAKAPAGVILLDNAVGESDSLRIEVPTLVINAGKDPDEHYQFGEFLVEARRNAQGRKLATEFLLLEDAQPGVLAVQKDADQAKVSIDPRATDAIVRWLGERRG